MSEQINIYPQTCGTLRIKKGIPVTVTDPGYDDDCICVLHRQMKPGKYTCVIYRGRDSYKDNDGKRHSHTKNFAVGVYLVTQNEAGGDKINLPTTDEWENAKGIGDIGVDAGMAGFFQNKPNYDDSEWDDICERINAKRNECLCLSYGFFSHTAYGDGVYPVYGYYNADHELIGMDIRF